MEVNQNAANIDEKGILPTEEQIICKIVFCGLANRSVNIVI
jgi:hypothetical protein